MVTGDFTIACFILLNTNTLCDGFCQDTTCMGGLVLVLSNPQQSVVTLALEVSMNVTV